MNTGVSFVLFFWIITPILYFTNTWNSSYFPISTYRAYANDGKPYKVLNILTNGVLDPVKYAAYSPVFLSTTNALAYGLGFASLPSVLVHTFCKSELLIPPSSHTYNPSLTSVVPKGYRPPIPQLPEG
jgi:hypothetical protein